MPDTTICGYDRVTLRWALCEFNGPVVQMALRWASAIDMPTCAVDINDPAKLAAIIAELLQECGWQVCDDDPGDDLQLPAAEVFVDGAGIGLHLYRVWSDCHNEPPFTGLTMSQARALALALLDAPNATTQDIERMIGEATR